MNLNTSIFYKLRPVSFRLQPWTRDKPPSHSKPTDNPLRAIVEFARHMRIKEVPAATSEKLRSDSYFKYCFYQLKTVCSNYDDDNTKPRRDRMAELIKNPELMNKKDLCNGLAHYLNNFPGYLPGGGNFSFLKYGFSEDKVKELKLTIDTVNTVLKETNFLKRAKAQKRAINKNYQDIDKKAAYLKLALKVFNIMVDEYGFDPHKLWE